MNNIFFNPRNAFPGEGGLGCKKATPAVHRSRNRRFGPFTVLMGLPAENPLQDAMDNKDLQQRTICFILLIKSGDR
jgi:hypothetical protein